MYSKLPENTYEFIKGEVGVIVEAPTKLVWANPDGSFFVAGRSKSNPERPDRSNPGRFKTFYPGGNKK